MSITTKLWRVHNDSLKEIQAATLPAEKSLEDWLERDQTLLGERLLVLKRQARTEFGGIIDLVALDAAGVPCIIELKRALSPREATAQLLDYGSWLATLTTAQFEDFFASDDGESLESRFKKHFNSELPEYDPRRHRLILVAPTLDESSERIINYLATLYKVNINSVSFNVFEDSGGQILARSWLIDPVDLARIADAGGAAQQWEWTGYWYVNVGQQPESYAENINRSWKDCVTYGMISAGQGRRWSSQLEKLREGDEIFAWLNKHGYVGYGKVSRAAVPASEFIPEKYEVPLSQLPTVGNALQSHADDVELADYVVGVNWHATRTPETALTFKGIFAKQFVVCKLSDPSTLLYLKEQFGIK